MKIDLILTAVVFFHLGQVEVQGHPRILPGGNGGYGHGLSGRGGYGHGGYGQGHGGYGWNKPGMGNPQKKAGDDDTPSPLKTSGGNPGLKQPGTGYQPKNPGQNDSNNPIPLNIPSGVTPETPNGVNPGSNAGSYDPLKTPNGVQPGRNRASYGPFQHCCSILYKWCCPGGPPYEICENLACENLRN